MARKHTEEGILELLTYHISWVGVGIIHHYHIILDVTQSSSILIRLLSSSHIIIEHLTLKWIHQRIQTISLALRVRRYTQSIWCTRLLDIPWLGLFNKRQTLYFQLVHTSCADSLSTEAACHIIGLHSVNCRSCRWENVSPRISGNLATWSTTCISCSWVIYDHEFNAKEETHHIVSSLFNHIEHTCFSLHFLRIFSLTDSNRYHAVGNCTVHSSCRGHPGYGIWPHSLRNGPFYHHRYSSSPFLVLRCSPRSI